MKKTLLPLLFTVLFVAQTAYASVVLNSHYFPDPVFRSYISKITNVAEDHTIPDNVIANVRKIDVTQREVSSLVGIRYFTNLEILYCAKNTLNSYDFDISMLPELKELDCSVNNLTTLNLANNSKLEKLDCSHNYCTTLDVSHNTKLREFRCNKSSRLTGLDVSGNTKLEVLSASNCNLKELDLSNNPELKELHVNDNELLALFLDNNPKLTGLDCSNNLLQRLDLSMCSHFDLLRTSGNRLLAINGLNRAMGLSGGSSFELGQQTSTRRFSRVAYNSNEENAWGIYLWANDINASNILFLKIDGEETYPTLYNGYLIVSKDLRHIPRTIEYSFKSYDNVIMPVSVNYDVVNYGIIINGKEMTSLDMNRVPGIVSGKAYLNDGAGWGTLGWANEPTLVLDNATLEYNNTNESYAFHNSACFNFTIKVIGDCYIISDAIATMYLDIPTNTYINGGGTLNVVNIRNGKYSGCAIELNDYGYLYLQEGTTLIADSYKGYGFYDVGDGKLDIGSGCTFCVHSAKGEPLSLSKKFVMADDIALRYPVGAYKQNGSYYYADGTWLSKDWIVFGPEGATHPEESIAVGISPLKETKEWTSIYNLAGQRLNKMQKGINIIGGKKVLLR